MRFNYEKVLEFVKLNSDCILLSDTFKTTKDKLLFKCNCGNEFETNLDKFKNSNKRKCNECSYILNNKKQSLTLEEVIKYVKQNSDCELISDEYINTKTKLEFKCRCGNLFTKTFEKFKTKNKTCKACSYENISKSQTFDLTYVKDYIESKSCELISKEYVNCEDKLDIKCKCGNMYNVNFNSFKNNNQIRCRKCTNQMSKGEIIIEEFLIINELEYATQYTFDDLKAKNNKHSLKFDFAVFRNGNLHMLIEFDGKQHDNPVEYFGGIEAFDVLKDNDNSKNKYCNDNNIELVRIPYSQLKLINDILSEKLTMQIPC